MYETKVDKNTDLPKYSKNRKHGEMVYTEQFKEAYRKFKSICAKSFLRIIRYKYHNMNTCIMSF